MNSMNRYEALDRLYSRLLERSEEPMITAKWTPVADILETRDSYIIRAELPGIDEKDIHVEVENSILTLKGERKHDSKTEEKDFRRIERTYGSFFRSFTLPQNVQSDKISAAFVNGVVEIVIPKREEAKPKKITLEIKKNLASVA